MSETSINLPTTLIRPQYPFANAENRQECKQAWLEYLDYLDRFFPHSIHLSNEMSTANMEGTSHLLARIQHSKVLYARYWWRESLWIISSRIKQFLLQITRAISHFLFAPPDTDRDTDMKIAILVVTSVPLLLIPLFIGVHYAEERIHAIPGLQTLGHYMQLDEVYLFLSALFCCSLVIRRHILKVSFKSLLWTLIIVGIGQAIIVQMAHNI